MGYPGDRRQKGHQKGLEQKEPSDCIPLSFNSTQDASFSGSIHQVFSVKQPTAIGRAEITTQHGAGWRAHLASLVVLQQDDDESLLKAGCAHHASLLHTL